MTDDHAKRQQVDIALREAITTLIRASRRLQTLQSWHRLADPRLEPDSWPPPLHPNQWQRALHRVGVNLGEMRRATADVSSALGLGSAQDRLLHYFRAHVGEAVPGDALSLISGISAWQRRVRELRVEHGWPIESKVQRPTLATDEYVLVGDAPDANLAASWRLAKQIRSRETSGKARLLEYLQAVSPQPADQDQLDYVAKIKSWQRRMRELDEEGWEIRSNIDEPELPPGTYRLASLERRPPRATEAIKLRYSILERDNFACQDCGRARGEPEIRLQVHHILPRHQGGTNDPLNLVTLCSACHAGRHSLMTCDSPGDELLDPAAELPVIEEHQFLANPTKD